MAEDKQRFNIKTFFSGTTFVERYIVKYLDIILYLTLLAFLYMGNRYSCEKKLLDIRQTNENIKEYRFLSMTLAAKMVNNERQSTLIKTLKANGIELYEPDEPLKVIERK